MKYKAKKEKEAIFFYPQGEKRATIGIDLGLWEEIVNQIKKDLKKK